MKCGTCDLETTPLDVVGYQVHQCPTCLGTHIDYITVERVVLDGRGAEFLVALGEGTRKREREAYRDPLTGLHNRKWFNQKLLVEAGRAVGGKDLTLLVFDLDGFKETNDTFGHTAGDTVLERFGEILMRSTRDGDFPARLGGDEFAVIMPGSDKKGAIALARRIIESTARYRFETKDGKEIVGIGVSAGFATYPDDLGVRYHRRTDAQRLNGALYELADRALYAAKEAGKGCVMGARQAAEKPVPSSAPAVVKRPRRRAARRAAPAPA